MAVCVFPAALNTDTEPPGPTGTTTRLATVCPFGGLRFDVVGRVPPPGWTVR